MRHDRRLARVLLASTFAILPALVAAGPTLDRLQSGGTIRLGYRADAAPFAYQDRAGRVRGYSVELCEAAVAEVEKALGGRKLAIEWTPLAAGERIDAVTSGRVDLECGTTTITLGRMASVDFSLPIYVDGGALLVRTNSKIAKLADLKGRRIAVIPGTTTEQAVANTLSAVGAPATTVPVRDLAEGMAALVAGRVDALAGDRIVLTTLRARTASPTATDFIPTDISYEPYALVMRRDDPDFRLAVNRALVELYRSGGIDPIFHRHFGALGRPGPMLHAMFYLATLPR